MVESVIGFSKQHGNLAIICAHGIAIRTTIEKVRILLKNIYKEKIKDIRFALLYGSIKDFGDIDIFIVGGENPKDKK